MASRWIGEMPEFKRIFSIRCGLADTDGVRHCSFIPVMGEPSRAEAVERIRFSGLPDGSIVADIRSMKQGFAVELNAATDCILKDLKAECRGRNAK